MFKNFKIPSWLNFYSVTLILFGIWMLFFDSRNLMSQFRLYSELRALQNNKNYYQTKILEVKEEQAQLFGNNKTLEKFAREKYLMKRKQEDIFYINEADIVK